VRFIHAFDIHTLFGVNSFGMEANMKRDIARIKIKNKKISVLQIIRLFIQIIFFVILPALYIQAFVGIRIIFESILKWNFSKEIVPSLVEVIAIFPVTILFGRFFCGWLCGFGSFLDFIYKSLRTVFKKEIKISEKIDNALKSLKYIILILLIIFSWTFGFQIFNKLSPWDIFGMTVIIGNKIDIPSAFNILPIAFIFFILIIIASAFIERFFCRYLCPLGAVFSISSRFKIGRIKKPRENCGACRMCTKFCPMKIPLYKMDDVKSGECINCMKCVSVCTKYNAGYNIAKKDIKPIVISGISIGLITGSYYTVYSLAKNIDTSSINAEISSNGQAKYKDGVYTGVGNGFRGEIKIAVTVSNGMLVKLETISTKDDENYYNNAFSNIRKNIILTQGIDVSVVTGATYSSKGIIEAVRNAISDIIINGETKKETSSIESTTSKEQTTTYNTTYIDGLYTGIGNGYKGIINIELEIESGKIKSIKTISSNDDFEFYNMAFTNISNEIIALQCPDVLPTTGATYSSNGIINATRDALNKARLIKEETSSTSSEIIATTKEIGTTKPNIVYNGFIDGVYIGSATGYNGELKLRVTINGGKIEDITTISSMDDPEYYSKAFTGIKSHTIKFQNPNAGIITGATYSSYGIINALKSALNNAGTFPSETIMETTNQETTQVTEVITNTTANIISNKYKDGTYIGQGNGYRGLVQLSVVISNGEIFSITTILSTDDAKYYNMAFQNITNKIILNQTYLVNTVTGATYSSNGIIAAVTNALSKAATTIPSETQTTIITETKKDGEDTEDIEDTKDGEDIEDSEDDD